VLLKTEIDTTNDSHFTAILLNVNPVFVDYSMDDYQLQATSPAINAGDSSFLDMDTQNDIKSINRGTSPDLGAYENQ
jgi:hypothetical protein